MDKGEKEDAKNAAPGARASLWPVLLALALFSVSLFGDYVYDDGPVVRDNTSILSLSGAGRLFTEEYWGDAAPGNGLYRPFLLSTFALDIALYGQGPLGHHVTNLLVYALAVFLVYRLLLLVAGRRIALPAACLFAVMPVHVEAVSYLVGRADALSFALSAAALLLAAKSWRNSSSGKFFPLAASGVLFTLALLTKESAVTLPALTFLLAFVMKSTEKEDAFPWRQASVAAAPALVVQFIVILAYLLLRYEVLGRLLLGEEAQYFADLSLLRRLYLSGGLLGAYLFHSLVPLDLLPVYGHWFGPRGPDPSALLRWSLLGLLGLVPPALVLRAFLRRRPLLLFASAWFVLSLAPVLQIVPIGTPLADRLAFGASLGAALLASLVLERLADRRGKTIGRLLLAGFLSVYALLCADYQLTWRSSLSLWEHAADRAPTLFTPRLNLANALSDAGRNAEALALYRELREEYPEREKVLLALAVYWKKQGRPRRAQELLTEALQIRPDYFEALVESGNLFYETGRYTEALAKYEKALEIRPNHARTLCNRAMSVLATQGAGEAERIFRNLARDHPGYERIRYGLALSLFTMGRASEAERVIREGCPALEECRKLLRKIEGTRCNLAPLFEIIVLAEKGRVREALRVLNGRPWLVLDPFFSPYAPLEVVRAFRGE